MLVALSTALSSIPAEGQDFKIVYDKTAPWDDCYDEPPDQEVDPDEMCTPLRQYNAVVFDTRDFGVKDASNPRNEKAVGPWRAYPSLNVCPDKDGDGKQSCPVNKDMVLMGTVSSEQNEMTTDGLNYTKKLFPPPDFLKPDLLQDDRMAASNAPDAVRFVGPCSDVIPTVRIVHEYCDGKESKPLAGCELGDPSYSVSYEYKNLPHRFCNVETEIQTPYSRLDCNDSDKTNSNGGSKDFKIVSIQRAPGEAEAAFKARSVKPIGNGYYNPFDSLRITIETDACPAQDESTYPHLSTAASLQSENAGKSINLALLEFPYSYKRTLARRRIATLRGNYNYSQDSVPEFSGLLSSDSRVTNNPPNEGQDYGGWFSSNPRTWAQRQQSKDDPYRDFEALIEEMRRLDAGIGANFKFKLKQVDAAGMSPEYHTASFPLPVSLCVPVYGNGPNAVVVSRPKERDESAGVPWGSLSIWPAKVLPIKFLLFSPLKQNIKEFAFYADLTAFHEVAIGGGKEPWTVTLYGKPACSFDAVKVLLSHKVDRAVTNMVYREIDMSTLAATSHYYPTLMHEFGHAFAMLNDEYIFDLAISLPNWFAFTHYFRKNCAHSSDIGSLFPPPSNVPSFDRAGCYLPGLFRSTLNSLMKDHKPVGASFNVVSCAYILRAIKGGEASSYWKTCEGYSDVTKK